MKLLNTFSSFFSQYVPLGSLYQVLHEGSGLVVDASKAIQFAIDVAKVLYIIKPRYSEFCNINTLKPQ